MTRVAYNLTGLKRIAHVAAVALCTASSLTLIGALPASEANAPKAPAAKAATVAKEVALPAIATPAPKTELLVAAVPAVRKSRTIQMEVTAYCACTKCCGPDAQGITASGKLVSYNDGKFVAADTTVLPFGTKLVIPGYANDEAVEVIDRGGAIKGNKLDLYFDSHQDALVWGRQHLEVTVYE